MNSTNYLRLDEVGFSFLLLITSFPNSSLLFSQKYKHHYEWPEMESFGLQEVLLGATGIKLRLS